MVSGVFRRGSVSQVLIMNKNKTHVCTCKGSHIHKIIFHQDDVYHPRLVFRINPNAKKHSEYSTFLGYETKKFYLKAKGCKRFERRDKLDSITAIGLNVVIAERKFTTVPLFSKKEFRKQQSLKLIGDL